MTDPAVQSPTIMARETAEAPARCAEQLKRNAEGATVNWMFDVDSARTKLARAYPDIDQS